MIRRLPLGSLRVFVSVAEHLNFTRAAEALGVTASAASLQVRGLEEYLGRSLLRRDGRHVHLTEEGAALLPRVRRALEDLEWLVPVCTPALLHKHGPVDDPKNLERYRLLHSDSEPWSLWCARDPAQAHTADVPAAQFDDSTVIVRSAMRGHGLALARWSLVADEVADGTLVLACRKPVAYPQSYWFVYPRRARSLASVAAFKAWIFEEAARFAAPCGEVRRQAPG